MILPLEKQVCSLEYARELKMLGVRQESYLYWFHANYGEKVPRAWILTTSKQTPRPDYIAAFTVAELGELLPPYVFTIHVPTSTPLAPKELTGKWVCEKEDEKGFRSQFTDNTEANARAKMLIYLIKQGIVKP